MGEYADVKRGRMLKLLKWVDNLPGFSVNNGGKHQWVVKHETWNTAYPIPFKHNVVNKHIVKALMNKVVATEECTKNEFDKKIK